MQKIKKFIGLSTRKYQKTQLLTLNPLLWINFFGTWQLGQMLYIIGLYRHVKNKKNSWYPWQENVKKTIFDTDLLLIPGLISLKPDTWARYFIIKVSTAIQNSKNS